MFKEIVKNLIDTLEKVHKSLSEAYFETYGDNELTQELNAEIKLRQRRNKSDFIGVAMQYAIKQAYEKDNYLITPIQAGIIAEALFKEAKEKGYIDELNKCNEENLNELF